jgi:FkbM family methyltransferase
MSSVEGKPVEPIAESTRATVAVNLPDIPDFTMEVHKSGDRFISEEIRRTGRWEPFETQVFTRLLAADVEFFDVGANIGWYSVLAGKQLESRGSVHAFEPVPENVGLLARNAAGNALNNIRINPFALGQVTGATRIFLSPDNKGDHRAYPSGEERQSVAVGMCRFDAYFDRSTRRPLLIKMDTQGSEYDVLVGMGDILERHSAEIALVMEFWPHGLAENGADAGVLIDFLASRQFVPWVLWEGEPRLCPTNWDSLAAAARASLAPATHEYVNLFLSRGAAGLASRLEGLYSTAPSRLVPPC